MKIAIDFRNTYYNDPSLSVFTRECWEDIAQLKPDHQFIFLKTRKDLIFSNLSNVEIREQGFAGIAWYDRWNLNRSLRRLRAGRVVSILPTGFRIRHSVRKKNASADQLLLFEPNGDAHLQGAKPAPMVTVVAPAGRGTAIELSWAAAESVRTRFTGGRSFFLFNGNISEQHQLIALLKAFSAFKKWQQSNMQLVIAGYVTGGTAAFEEKLQQYKFRGEVVLLKNPSAATATELMGACYAVLMPVAENIFCPALLFALQAGKALIATDQPVTRAIITRAEWIDKTDTAEGFAKAMISLYKDEKKLQGLEQQSREAALQLNRSRLLAALWDSIEK